jgi:hypothetical protein
MRAKEFIIESTDVITINKRLNPLLWDRGVLNPEIRDKLTDIAGAFIDNVGVELNVVDLTVTGSNANYTWTKHSDLDLHIIVAGEITDSARELFTAKKALWGSQHKITIKGLPVECYIQAEQEPHHSTGVYSILKDAWVVTPKKIKPRIDDSAVAAKLESLVHLAQQALEQDNLTTISRVKDKITKMRQAGLDRAGEWSTENLVFKQLRNMGLIDDLADRARELQDKELSLEQAKPGN